MDRIRFGLWFALLAAVWISYTTWVAENQPEAPAAAEGASTAGADDLRAADSDDGSVPAIGDANGVPGAAGQPPSDEAAGAERLIAVETDVLDVRIDLDGGDIVWVELPAYPVDKNDPDRHVRLLDYAPGNRWVFQTGLSSREGVPAPNHLQAFTSAESSYRLADGAETLEVRLAWTGANGVSAEKVYTFRRGAYAVDLDLVARNDGTEPWRALAYAQMTRLHSPAGRSFLDVDSYSYTGPALYDGDSYKKHDFEDLQQSPVELAVSNGWVASIQHHFLGAIVPLAEEPTTLTAQATDGGNYRLRARSPEKTVDPGEALSYPLRLFVGPKLQDQLDEAAPGRELKRSVDYGMLYFLSQPLFIVLDFIHGWVGNWGWSIVITTILIKLAFYKLTATSGRSMAKMRKLAPRMKALQEKHKADRQALSAAMMDLYKKEKVNPAAGCLPILIQMPFFFAFYWVLIESVEMRQAPFVLWINDLSVRDPFFILPLLMGAAMWFQMKLNPAPPDPVQARVMQIMPIVFTAMFAFFPAGLVLYWLTNTLISFAQQWRINQLVARES